jgi:hypothetical protein
MYITGHKVYNGQHQNVSWHHPSFLRKRWIGWRADKKKNSFVLPAIRTPFAYLSYFKVGIFLKNPALVWWLAETNSLNMTNSNNFFLQTFGNLETAFSRKKNLGMCLGFRVLKFRVMCLRNMKFHIFCRWSSRCCTNLFEFPKNRQPSITIFTKEPEINLALLWLTRSNVVTKFENHGYIPELGLWFFENHFCVSP